MISSVAFLCFLLIETGAVWRWKNDTYTLRSAVFNNSRRNQDKTDSFGEIPDIFLIGGQKCGSTSLWKKLLEHPDFCKNSEIKESHFFETNAFDNGATYYRTIMKADNCKKGELIVDATPDYIKHELAAVRIKQSYSAEELGKKKFILILREPVMREFSLYRHFLRECRATIYERKTSNASNLCVSDWNPFARHGCWKLGCYALTPDQIKSQNPAISLRTFAMYYGNQSLDVSGSHYLSQLKAWSKHIPRDNIFIVNFDALAANISHVLQRLQEYLGLSLPWTETTLPKVNKADVEGALDCETFKALHKQFETANFGLIDFINSPGKNPWQPYFSSFEDIKMHCSN